jgi:hypothetical protein
MRLLLMLLLMLLLQVEERAVVVVVVVVAAMMQHLEAALWIAASTKLWPLFHRWKASDTTSDASSCSKK